MKNPDKFFKRNYLRDSEYSIALHAIWNTKPTWEQILIVTKTAAADSKFETTEEHSRAHPVPTPSMIAKYRVNRKYCSAVLGRWPRKYTSGVYRTPVGSKFKRGEVDSWAKGEKVNYKKCGKCWLSNRYAKWNQKLSREIEMMDIGKGMHVM